MSEIEREASVWQRAEVETPCVQVCVIHPVTGLCLGCARDAHEISLWSRMSPEARRAIMDALPSREAAPKARRGGRIGRAAS